LIFYGKSGDHNWPPRSCDLTPCDFFLYSHVKDKVYANSPASIQDLIDEFREAILLLSCRRGRGGHLADVVFHY